MANCQVGWLSLMFIQVSGRNSHRTIELPMRLGSIVIGTAGNVDLKIVEVIGDFGVAASQPVVQSVKYIGPVICIVTSLSHGEPPYNCSAFADKVCFCMIDFRFDHVPQKIRIKTDHAIVTKIQCIGSENYHPVAPVYLLSPVIFNAGGESIEIG